MDKVNVLNTYRFVKCYPIIPGITDSPKITKILLEARVFTVLKVDPKQNKPNSEIITYDTRLPVTLLEFIAPQEIVDSVSHQYETPESIIQNASGKITTATEVLKNFFKGKGNTFAHTRVDVPIHYKDSEHRKYDFVFNLSSYDDPENNIVLPVFILKTLSCATAGNNGFKSNTNILPPCVFKIKIKPFVGNSIVYMQFAALENVQATYKGPYNKGKPTTCDLQLSFREYTPLFDTNFTEDETNNINVTSKVNGKILQNQPMAPNGKEYNEFWGIKSDPTYGPTRLAAANKQAYGNRTKEQYNRASSAGLL